MNKDKSFLIKIKDAIHGGSPREISESVFFNGISPSDCSNNWRYDRNSEKFIFDIKLGDCNMFTVINKHGGKSFIKFTEEISVAKFAGKESLYFGYTSLFQFSCNYRTKTSTGLV